MFKIILLFLPATVLAKIDVNLSIEFNGVDSNFSIYFGGYDVGIITDTERNTFNLSDRNLKNAVRLLYKKPPDEAYLCSPTPWGDLYQLQGWQQVTRTLRPQNKIMNINTKTPIILQQVFENSKSEPKTFNFDISQQLLNTISSSWSTEGELSIGQNISYNIKLNVRGVGEETSFSYTSPWGKNSKLSQIVTVGATSSMEIILQPGQSIIAILLATIRIIQLELEYVASLSGRTVANYIDSDNNNNFCTPEISYCMKSAGLINKKVSREVLNIVFNEDTKVIVQDLSYDK